MLGFQARLRRLGGDLQAGSSTLRAVALLGAGALAVHHLRYAAGALGNGLAPTEALDHSYLSLAVSLVALLAAAAVACFGAEIVRARRTTIAPAYGAPLGGRWLAAGLFLSGFYVVQEWIEGQLNTGHPVGVHEIVGHGGWIAFVLAFAVAGMIVVLLRGASAAIEYVAHRFSARRPSTAEQPERATPQTWIRPRAFLAWHLAGRSPPLLT